MRNYRELVIRETQDLHTSGCVIGTYLQKKSRRKWGILCAFDFLMSNL